MPRSNFSEQSIATFSDDSSSDHLSACYDVGSFEPASQILSDQTLLKQAFRGTVNGRKEVAREWRTERECDISLSARIAEAEEVVSTPKKSYVRSLMQKLHLVGK